MDTPIVSAGGGDGAEGDLIKDTTTEAFARDVLDASREQPVIVDFWAPWCGPCRQLGPVLEKVVKAARGAVRMVKMNIDEHPGVAAQLGVQSIPAVFAFKDGRPVDGFLGALPESQVKAFVERLVGEGALDGPKAVLEAAEEALEGGELQAAAEMFAAVLAEDKQNWDALAGLAKCYVRTGDLDRAEQTLAMAPADKASHPAIAKAKAMLELARKAGEAGDLDELRKAVEKDPDDHQARFDLAVALAASGEREGAVDALLEILRREPGWNEEAARKQLLQLFDAWGASDPATVEGRRKLSTLLFS